MIHTKRVIFMILPLLFVPLVYSISSTPDACAVPPDAGWSTSKNCHWDPRDPDKTKLTCCWADKEGFTWCQTCTNTEDNFDCDPVFSQPPSPTGPFTPPQGGVEQSPTATPPPLFGENTNVPPTGGVEQPPTTTTPQIPPRLPGGGAGVPTEGGSAEQPPQTVAPQDDQDNQGGGCLLSKTKRMSHLAVL